MDCCFSETEVEHKGGMVETVSLFCHKIADDLSEIFFVITVRIHERQFEIIIRRTSFACFFFQIDLFHIIISLSLEARYLARFRVTSHAWGKL